MIVACTLSRPECNPIPIPQNDPYFHKFGRRSVRSLAATDNSGLGTCILGHIFNLASVRNGLYSLNFKNTLY